MPRLLRAPTGHPRDGAEQERLDAATCECGVLDPTGSAPSRWIRGFRQLSPAAATGSIGVLCLSDIWSRRLTGYMRQGERSRVVQQHTGRPMGMRMAPQHHRRQWASFMDTCIRSRAVSRSNGWVSAMTSALRVRGSSSPCRWAMPKIRVEGLRHGGLMRRPPARTLDTKAPHNDLAKQRAGHAVGTPTGVLRRLGCKSSA